jgi:hypothetical protein
MMAPVTAIRMVLPFSRVRNGRVRAALGPAAR